MSYPILPILIEILKLLFAICLPSNTLQEVEAKVRFTVCVCQ